MTICNLYALNQVQEGHIAREELEVSPTKNTLATHYFQKTLNATKCGIHHQLEKWQCEHEDHGSTDHAIAGLTSDKVTSPEKCHSSSERETVVPGCSIFGT